MHSTRRRAASNGKRLKRHQRERAPLAGIAISASVRRWPGSPSARACAAGRDRHQRERAPLAGIERARRNAHC
jgi:hypothetical protein